MESVNKKDIGEFKFLTGSLFRSLGQAATRTGRGEPASFDVMTRVTRALWPAAMLVALVAIAVISVDDSRAELENQVFTSRADRLRLVVPRGWRATDHPTYPGLLLWMMRSQPPGQIVLTSETFTRELYCSWPSVCRATTDTPTTKYACAIRAKLQAQRIVVGPVQAGPKENVAAGLPSVYFEYDDGKRYLRQAIAVTADRAISLVLSAPSLEARSSHVRAFDQALRTLRLLTPAETAPPNGDAGVAPGGDAAIAAAADARPADAGAILDAAPPTVGVTFESAPAPKIDPIGPCPK